MLIHPIKPDDPYSDLPQHIQFKFTVYQTIKLIGLINLQSASSTNGFCLLLPSSKDFCVGILGVFQGIIRNFKSVLHSAGGHFKVTGEHGVLSAVCTY